jgi:hypothetical protein
MRRRRRRRRRGSKVMVVKRKMTPMSSPPSLLAAMERGRLRRNLATSLIPRKATKPPISNKVVPLLTFLPDTSKE